MTWKLVYTKQAQQDAKKLASSSLKPKVRELLALIAEDPYRKPPPFEKLIGDFAGASSDVRIHGQIRPTPFVTPVNQGHGTCHHSPECPETCQPGQRQCVNCYGGGER